MAAPGSLQTKFHLCPRRQMPPPWLLTYVLNFFGCWQPLSPLLGLFFGLWIIYMDKKIPQDPAEISPKWLVKQALDNASHQHWDLFGTQLAERFFMSKVLLLILPTLSWDTARVSAIFLADILLSNRIMEWMAATFSGIVTWVGISQCSSSVLECPVLNLTTQLLTVERKGVYHLMQPTNPKFLWPSSLLGKDIASPLCCSEIYFVLHHFHFRSTINIK
jgi:hypothetical protein